MPERETETRNVQTEQSRTQDATSTQRGQESSGNQNRGLTARTQNPPIFSVSPGEFFTMSPITLMRRFTEDMDRAFGFGPGAARGSSSENELSWVPRVEVRQSGNNLTIEAEVPGVNENELKVEATEEGLVIQGERKREDQSRQGEWQRSEFSYGRFFRLIPLPENAKVDQAQANFRNGVLEITVPVSEEESRRRQIPIGTTARSQGGNQTSPSTAGERTRTASSTR